MRLFIIEWMLFVGGLLLLGAGMTAVALGVPASFLSPDDYNMALLDKVERLRHAPSSPRRLLLVGGSNLAFGLDSQTLEDALGWPVINMGLNAGMGLGFALTMLEPWLRDGDVVLIAPEYGQFYGWHGDFNRYAVTIDILRLGPMVLWRPGLYGWPNQLGEYVKWKIFNLLYGRTTATNPLLQRSGFDAYGDYRAHLEEPIRPFASAKPRQRLPPDAVFRSLDTWVNAVKARHTGLSFLVSYPPFESASFDNQRVLIDAVHAQLVESSWTIISDPADYRLERRFFFDSAYHPNAEGRRLRTDILMRDIEQWMKAL